MTTIYSISRNIQSMTEWETTKPTATSSNFNTNTENLQMAMGPIDIISMMYVGRVTTPTRLSPSRYLVEYARI